MDLLLLWTMADAQDTQTTNGQFYDDLWSIYKIISNTTITSNNQNMNIFFWTKWHHMAALYWSIFGVTSSA